MRILFIGDIVGRPGRDCIKKVIPELKKEYDLDFIIANGENSAGGLGITEAVANELFDADVNVITGGNHIWDKKDVFNFIDREKRLIRPLNYPPGTPGRGAAIYDVGKEKVGVINISGLVFMNDLDCPFRRVMEEIEIIKKSTNIIVIDFHAEATSEKIAMGWFLRKKVSAVIGTHTHVQTADEKILDNATAYITDVGMTGPYNSVLGVDTKLAVDKLISKLPVRLKVSDSQVLQLNALFIEVSQLGLCTRIERILRIVE